MLFSFSLKRFLLEVLFAYNVTFCSVLMVSFTCTFQLAYNVLYAIPQRCRYRQIICSYLAS